MLILKAVSLGPLHGYGIIQRIRQMSGKMLEVEQGSKHRAFTAVAVLTLALGIGANTAIFSVVDQLLVRPLPYSDPERLVMLWEVSPEGRHQNTISRANFRGWREQSTSFEGMAAFSDQRLSLTGDGEPEEVSVQYASPDLFRILGVKPALGRVLTEEDAHPGPPSAAILGDGLWRRRFGGDPGVVGKLITLNGRPAGGRCAAIQQGV